MNIQSLILGVIASTLRVATPLIYGTLGELFCERSGVLNLGIEGTMFMGAFSGFAIAFVTGSPELGILGALIIGALSGLMMGFFAVKLGVNQHVSGLGITLFLTGLSLFLSRVAFPKYQVLPSIKNVPPWNPFAGISWLGPIFEQYWLTYLLILILPIAWWILYRTNFGLDIRAVGENPEAADGAGVNVYRTRYLALAIGGGLMGVGGAFLSVAQLGAFSPGIIAGRGWVCIALIIFANWRPLGVLWGGLLFGSIFALELRLQTLGLKLPYETFLALPYVVTIIALAFAGRRVTGPAAVLKPYKRE
jgi:general nucleoside transport system permease protein